MEPSIVNQITNTPDFNGLKLFPQEALVCYLEDKERNKIFIWPREEFMGVSFLSYGKDLKEAMENLSEMLDYIPETASLVRVFMESQLRVQEPKEISFEEIGIGIKENMMMLVLGETNAMVLRPAVFIEHLLEGIDSILCEKRTKEALLEMFRGLKQVLIAWLEYNKKYNWKKVKI